MKQLYSKAVMLVFFSLILTACHANSPSIYSAKNLTELNGSTIDMAAYKGKWVIINYWADWCGPCANEIPQLNAFYHQHQNKDAVIFAVNYDQLSTQQLKKTIRAMKIQYPSIIGDPAVELHLGDITVVPMTFIFSPEGKLTYKLLGEQTKESLERKMKLH